MAAVKKTMAKEKCGKLVTPRGTALFANVINPSPFDESKYECTIVLDADAAEIVKKQLKEMCSEACDTLGIDVDSAIEELLKVDTDKEGNPTGKFRLRGKTGVEYPPRFVDATGKVFKPAPDFMIPNGSLIRLSLGIEAMVVKPRFKGLVARLNGLQIIKLAELTSEFDPVEEDNAFTADAFRANESSGDEWGTADESGGWE